MDSPQMKAISGIVQRMTVKPCGILHVTVDWVILFVNMLFRLQRKISILVILSYVTAGFLIAVSHHDVTDLALHSSATVTNHSCGSNERHIPLDKRHECLACMQSAMRIATATASASVTDVQFLALGSTPVDDRSTLSTDILHSGKRGPPIFS